MKAKLYHVCISSSELMFRVEADYVEGINRLAISAFLTDTTILAYALMSNHIHIVIRSSTVSKFVQSFRTSYNKWFNYKYRRRGRLGNKKYYPLSLNYNTHIVDALSYVLKNGLHHNLVEYPSEYLFSSARYYFMKEFGIKHMYTEMNLESNIRKVISYRGALPSNIKMDTSGMFIPESFLAIDMVEEFYGSVRQFAYHMNKLMAEEWAVTSIEAWRKGILPAKIKNKVLHISDIEICTKLDLALEKRNLTYVELSQSQKQSISDAYIKQFAATPNQMKRCLNYTTSPANP